MVGETGKRHREPCGVGEWRPKPTGGCPIVVALPMPWESDVAARAESFITSDADQARLAAMVSAEIACREPLCVVLSRPAWRTLRDTFGGTGRTLHQDYCYALFIDPEAA